MNMNYINRALRVLTLSLCLGVIFSHTTVYAAGEIARPMLGDQSIAKGVGLPGGGGRVCEDTFNLHKGEIEGMIAAGNNAGVKAIFDKAGCTQVALKVSGSQDKMASKVRCTFTLIPPAIICTFGVK